MTIKRVLTIKDENYNEEFEVFSKNGLFKHNNIIIIDEFEVAQRCLEEVTTYNDKDEFCYVNQKQLNKYIEDIIKKVTDELTIDIIQVALDNVDDDEEIKWDKGD